MTIKLQADEANWNFDQIPVLSKEKLELLSEDAHFIHKSVALTGKKTGRAWRTEVEVKVYWAQEADVLLWLHPQPMIGSQGILFDGYAEFVLWFGWKMRANFGCSAPEMDRIRDEVECWRVMILFPNRLKDVTPKTSHPLESTLELI